MKTTIKIFAMLACVASSVFAHDHSDQELTELSSFECDFYRICTPEKKAAIQSQIEMNKKVAENAYTAHIEEMIANKAELNSAGLLGRTLLIEAAELGYATAVQLLLNNGAQVDLADANGETPLRAAARNGELAVAQLLLSAGANSNAKDKWDLTPLHLAASNVGNVELVQLLLDNNANVNAVDTFKRTALQCAEDNLKEEVAQLLRKSMSKND